MDVLSWGEVVSSLVLSTSPCGKLRDWPELAWGTVAAQTQHPTAPSIPAARSVEWEESHSESFLATPTILGNGSLIYYFN